MLVLILYICFCSAYLKSENAALYLILPCNSKEITKMNPFVEFEAINLGIFFILPNLIWQNFDMQLCQNFCLVLWDFFLPVELLLAMLTSQLFKHCIRISWDPGIRVLVYCAKKAKPRFFFFAHERTYFHKTICLKPQKLKELYLLSWLRFVHLIELSTVEAEMQ